MLQTRNGKRTAPRGSLKIAVDMAREGLIDRVRRRSSAVEPAALDQLLHPPARSQAEAQACWRRGLPASPGAACGARRVQRR